MMKQNSENKSTVDSTGKTNNKTKIKTHEEMHNIIIDAIKQVLPNYVLINDKK